MDGGFAGPAQSLGNGTAMAVGDFNEDGHPDLVLFDGDLPSLSCPADPVSVLLGDGDGGFHQGPVTTGVPAPQWVMVGDFNGDGHLDLAVVEPLQTAAPEYTPVLILLGDGTGAFTQDYWELSLPTEVNGFGAAADLNGDGKTDLVFWSSGPASSSGSGTGGTGGSASTPELDVYFAK